MSVVGSVSHNRIGDVSVARETRRSQRTWKAMGGSWTDGEADGDVSVNEAGGWRMSRSS